MWPFNSKKNEKEQTRPYFVPKTDITAFELAQMMPVLFFQFRKAKQLRERIKLLPIELQRHFEEREWK